jgi:hypothetical protein
MLWIRRNRDQMAVMDPDPDYLSMFQRNFRKKVYAFIPIFFSITTKCPGPDPGLIGLPNPDPSFRIKDPRILIPQEKFTHPQHYHKLRRKRFSRLFLHYKRS